MNEDGVWRTIRGRKVFIREGQDLKSAMQESNKFKKNLAFSSEKRDNIDRNIKSRETIRQFIKQKESNHKLPKSTQNEHKEKILSLNQDKYEDGTYDLNTMKKQNLESGYQVSFYQTGVKLSDEQYQKAHEECLKYSSDGKTYAGKFGGEPEISYNISNQKDAYMLMKKYNQHSMCKYREGGKIRFYYNYELNEKKNKTNFEKGGHK